MKKNMSNTDRIVRGIIGLVLIILGIMYLGFWWGILMLVIGIILLVTAIAGFCPLYALFRMSTYKK